MSLRAMLASVMAVLSVLVLAAAGSLVVLTSYLHRVTDRLSDSMEGVHLAEEMEVELLAHYWRSSEPPGVAREPVLERSSFEREFLSRLEKLSRLQATAQEQALIRDIQGPVASYLRSQRDASGGRSHEARGALEQEGTRAGELVNLAGRAGESRFEVELLRGALDAWLERDGHRVRGRERGAEPEDAETLERLKALGYL
jgi:hypothetical protein